MPELGQILRFWRGAKFCDDRCFLRSTAVVWVEAAAWLMLGDVVFGQTAGSQSYAFTNFAGRPGGQGNVDGTGSAARFYWPGGVAVDSVGSVYMADSENSTIREITPAGVVTTLAGPAGNLRSADGTGSASRFSYPSRVAVDGAPTACVAHGGSCTIRRVTPAGVVTTLADRLGVCRYRLRLIPDFMTTFGA